MLWVLLQKLPGYTAQSLLAEESSLVEQWLEILEAENREAAAEQRSLKAKMK